MLRKVKDRVFRLGILYSMIDISMNDCSSVLGKMSKAFSSRARSFLKQTRRYPAPRGRRSNQSQKDLEPECASPSHLPYESASKIGSRALLRAEQAPEEMAHARHKAWLLFAFDLPRLLSRDLYMGSLGSNRRGDGV